MATISDKCIKLVKEFEGCKLKAYKDEVGVWTIGYGITNSDKSITKTTIKSGTTISQATAEKWLKESLTKKYLPLVMKYNSKYKWNQNEIDALVSFCYNIGSIKQLTADGTRSRKEIAAAMLKYNKAGGKVYNGLTRRRKAEQKLFLTAVPVTLTSYLHGKGYGAGTPNLKKLALANIGTAEVKAALLTLAKNGKLTLPKDLAKWPK
jgi:lysozyme